MGSIMHILRLSRPRISSNGTEALSTILYFTFFDMESTVSSASSSSAPVERPLSLEEYKRYGRQMIMPDFGLPGESQY